MQELDNWKRVSRTDLDHIRGNVWQNKEDPELLGYVHFQGTLNSEPDPGFNTRIQSLEGLDHPNVLKLLEYDLQAERPFMVTELCKGGTLRDVDLSTWPVQKKMTCFYHICNAFSYLWDKGLMKSDHDFKNTFLKKDHTPVLGDFESARPIEKNAEGVLRVLDQAGKCFWEIMEGQEFSQVVAEELRMQRKIDELTQQIEGLEEQKTELLNDI